MTSGFFEAVNVTADLKLYVSVGFNMEVMLLHDFLGDYSVVDAEVLVLGNWGAYMIFKCLGKIGGIRVLHRIWCC